MLHGISHPAVGESLQLFLGLGSEKQPRKREDMEDDFDALIAELEQEEQKPAQAARAPAAASSFSAAPAVTGDEFDDLLAELDVPSAPKAAVAPPVRQAVSSGPTAKALGGGAADVDELDALMSELDGSSATVTSHSQSYVASPAKKVAAPAAVSAPAPADDLDALLGELGGITVAKTPVKAAPAPAKPAAAPVDDLDALMQQLDVGTPKAVASPSHSQFSSSATTTRAPAPVQPSVEDDLDALLGQLGGSSPSVAAKAPAPAAQSTEIDELDALLGDLGGQPLSNSSSSLSSSTSSFGGRGMGGAAASPAAGGRGMGSPSMGGRGMGSPSMAGRGMGSPSMGGRGMGSPSMRSPAMGGRGMGSPSMGGRGMGSPSMGGRGMGSPSMGGRAMGSPSMGRGRGAGAGAGGANLDNLLNSLSDQMANINDGNSASRGICAFCNKPVYGDVMQALGNSYHPEHFVCGTCEEPLGTKSFYESENRPTCERCYKNMFCPRCAFCNEAIPDRCITAMDRKWHVKCFVCNHCLQPFQGGEFFERNGMPHCRGCFTSTHATPCGGCGQMASGGAVVNALGRQWHVQCFACHFCKKPFNGQPFFAKEGVAYCQQHYHNEAGTNCKACKQPIEGRCVDALGGRYHPNCFVCAYCMNPLSGGGFTEKHGSAYCHECHANLF